MMLYTLDNIKIISLIYLLIKLFVLIIILVNQFFFIVQKKQSIYLLNQFLKSLIIAKTW